MATDITTVARDFFEACETGKGWEGCRAYCTEDATFSAQADVLADVTTLEGYADWMKGLLSILPDGRYELKTFAEDTERASVCAVAVFHGTHTGDGGPVPPTGKQVAADYVYNMEFEDGRVRHMTKIWNDARSLRDLGWQ
jgi:predicted ester cyclase